MTRSKLLTAQEVAQQLQVPVSFVYRLAREGRLPCVRLGRYRRFDPDDLAAWIESRKTRHLGPDGGSV